MVHRKNGFGRLIVLVVWAVLVLICTSAAFANVKLPAVINDNMVLQQKAKTLIWGWAEPGEKVSVKGSWQWFGKSTEADTDGKWMIKIRTPKAGGPYTIAIEGNNKIVLDDVLIGEVWICSGQSNMRFPVGKIGNWKTGAINYEKEIPAADYPRIRLFTVRQKTSQEIQKDCTGNWQLCSPGTIEKFSAVAYFFGRELHQKLNVPIGLIHASWGGSVAEAWTSRKTLQSYPELMPILEKYSRAVARYPEVNKKYLKKLKKWEETVAKVGREKAGYRPYSPMGLGHRDSPSGLYNGMIAPVMPYGIRGAIWYQGESNKNRASEYRILFPAMIKNWRDDWALGDFPFYYVQIAPFNYGSSGPTAAELREAQLMTLSVPNTGMAVTMDIGNVNDIHPKNKWDVGKRLALWALAKTYGQKGIVYSGPIYKSMAREKGKIRISFDYIDSGLTAKGGDLTDFVIAGENKVFVKAKAIIDGDTIVVSSTEVPNPIAVRFGWSNTAEPNLFNKAGLPASPFRTDN